MELLHKVEHIIHGWSKGTPDLPPAGRRWLGENAWWIVLVVAIITTLAFLMNLSSLFRQISLLSAPSNTYYVTSDFTSVAIFNTTVSLVIVGITAVLLWFAVKPLQSKQKKGWALLFFTLLIEALAVLVTAVFTFSFVGFIITILFGAIGLAIGAYFIFEIHGEFGHTTRRSVHEETK